MANIAINSIGKVGAITDVPGHELPAEGWTNSRNIRFLDGFAMRMCGEELNTEGTPPVAPTYLFPAPTPTTLFWVYTNLAKVYAVAGSTHTNITRQVASVDVDYTGALDNKWNGGWLNGVLILNNGVDLPQSWNPMQVATKLVNLPNFSEPGVTDLRAKVIRPFSNFLIGLDISKDSTRFPTMVKWSNRADPGTVPTSWDPASTIEDTGEVSLSETPGFLVDSLPLGNINIIYKENAIIRMQKTGGQFIFNFDSISHQAGAMAIGCMTEFKPGQHLVLTADRDIVVHNGQAVSSVLTKKNRRYIETIIDGTVFARSFVVSIPGRKEVWVCYPRVNDTYCTEAAVFNTVDATWSFKDISETVDMKTGAFDPNSTLSTWASQTDTWDVVTGTWATSAFMKGTPSTLGAFPVAVDIRKMDTGQKLGSTVYNSLLERQGLAIIGQGKDGTPKVDVGHTKLVTELWPEIEAAATSTFDISVGSQEKRTDPIDWEGPYTFQPSVDSHLDFLRDGKYISVRIQSSSEDEWKLFGYTLNMKVTGRYF